MLSIHAYFQHSYKSQLVVSFICLTENLFQIHVAFNQQLSIPLDE